MQIWTFINHILLLKKLYRKWREILIDNTCIFSQKKKKKKIKKWINQRSEINVWTRTVHYRRDRNVFYRWLTATYFHVDERTMCYIQYIFIQCICNLYIYIYLLPFNCILNNTKNFCSEILYIHTRFHWL